MSMASSVFFPEGPFCDRLGKAPPDPGAAERGVNSGTEKRKKLGSTDKLVRSYRRRRFAILGDDEHSQKDRQAPSSKGKRPKIHGDLPRGREQVPRRDQVTTKKTKKKGPGLANFSAYSRPLFC